MPEQVKPKNGYDGQATNPYAKLVSIAALLAVVIAVAGVAACIVWRTELEQQLSAEVFRITYQFLLITLIGGGVSLLFTQYIKAQEEQRQAEKKAQETRLAERLLQQEFYMKFIQAYNDAKRIRRLLRATSRRKSIDNSGINSINIELEPYEKWMQELINIQLKFETIEDEVEIKSHLFKKAIDPKELKDKLDSMEKYLNEIVGEYEDLYEIRSENTQILPVSRLPRLREFIDKYKQAKDFQVKFKEPAHKVMQSLLKVITSDS